ncbi:HNH endonuclease signature motif containing protein [Mycolicibacterium sp. P9-22]|uniref:HNH endonuclease signature motif containing protein n=1 Tax=Mycolicibacterium sp. P9-22 TaxID=2024613 RepID=UPI0021049A65|nr:HNH endonuclease signature motif containing protein [Mycolicibacterium sp. P9-22]
MSDERIAELVDWMVVDVDPEAVRRARQARQQRGITVEPIGDGMVEIHGRVDAAKGAVFDQGLDALARTVCPDDPRSFLERRADAVEPLSLGAKSIPCLCGREDCPAADNEVSKGHIVIHVLAEQATVTGASPKAALIPGYGVVHAEQIQEMVPHAEVRPLPIAADLGIEGGYQPSRKLADFIRCRDLTCRWPGCHVPVGRCDIDHTVPWPYGPTHPSNTKLYCRIHHLIKTFHCGPDGWTDQQHPDGTITITAPNGRVYTTTPDGPLFFPQFAVRTAELVPSTTPTASPHRELAAPKRSRTRAQNRTYRIAHERALNREYYEANPPPF